MKSLSRHPLLWTGISITALLSVGTYRFYRITPALRFSATETRLQVVWLLFLLASVGAAVWLRVQRSPRRAKPDGILHE